ncbi:MAG: hypothetical protein ING84_09050 [Cytophagales bacterium]|jgi:hypothetical protein|nr:hypothetical protein [Cytophagales bacterium]MCA6367869.1 hypothetical protein [Cytophagales bacterium]MCA6371044.1 hypothetical protein [Cytophagales bacterium]MCA6384645.1 hypothetical protein [Cytophagales bacterium]
MATKEEIKKEVDKLPANLLGEVYSYLKSVRDKNSLSEDEARRKWKEWWDDPETTFSPDFMNERIQPPLENRVKMFD